MVPSRGWNAVKLPYLEGRGCVKNRSMSKELCPHPLDTNGPKADRFYPKRELWIPRHRGAGRGWTSTGETRLREMLQTLGFGPRASGLGVTPHQQLWAGRVFTEGVMVNTM